MNKETKKMVMGFVEYLQSVYGADGGTASVKPVPPNSLAIPLFLTEKAPDSLSAFGSIGNAMGGTGGVRDYSTGDPNDLLAAIDSMMGAGMPPQPPMGGMGLSPGISAGMPAMPMAGAQQEVDPLQQMMMGM
jgi:hypothetical protein